jgi:glutathione S-transferase
MMPIRLLNDATSPFGRKVLVAAIERGLPVREEFVNVAEPGELDAHNPLRQIPTLVTEAGDAVYDSSVILGFLDTLHGGEPLVPPDPACRVTTRIALADGLIEATLQRAMELRRPGELQSAAVMERLEERIARALFAIDRIRTDLSLDPLRGDSITVACALAYVDFRYGRFWRDVLPALAAWQDAVAARPSMQATAPTRTAPVPVGPVPAGS